MTTDGSAGRFAVFSLARDTPHGERVTTIDRLTNALMPLLTRGKWSTSEVVLWTRNNQRDSRLIRKKGFWRLFPDLRSMLPPGAECRFTITESADGVRFLATARVSLSDLTMALATALRHTRCAGAVLVGAGSGGLRAATLDPALRASLDEAGSELELARLLLPLCEQHGVAVVIPTGRFDDRETGLFLCGPEEWSAALPDLAIED